MHTNLNSLFETSHSLSFGLESSQLQVRIQGVDGSLATFVQSDPAVVEHIVRDCQIFLA